MSIIKSFKRARNLVLFMHENQAAPRYTPSRIKYQIIGETDLAPDNQLVPQSQIKLLKTAFEVV